MPHSYVAPTRTLPSRPSLTQLRKQAKELLRTFLANEPAAVAEVQRFEQSVDRAEFTLADAQRILARAYGFASWTKLKLHVDGANVRAFREAVEAGDIVRVRRLAKVRPDLVTLSPDGEEGERLMLHLAVLRGDIEMTRVLMELGSDARSGIWPHRSSTSAYVIAKDRGYDGIVAIIEKEEHRRREKKSDAGAGDDATIAGLMKAIQQEDNARALAILNSDPTLIGACNRFGATPLHIAAAAHNTQMIAWLIDRGARVDAEAYFDVPLGSELGVVPGKTPLDYAAMVAGCSSHGKHFGYFENSAKGPERFEETVRLLRDGGAKLTVRGAVAIGDQAAVRQFHRDGKLINEIHTLRGGLLSIAVRVNRPEMVALLIDLGLDIDENVTGEEGSLLSWGMPLWFCAMGGRPEIADLLLSRGADPNSIVYACGGPLGIAEDVGDDETVAVIKKYGARLAVEAVAGGRDVETARAILDGKLQALSLNVAEPTPTDLAEQMLWAASGDEEIVRVCLPHMTRRRDDPWWNYVLLHATDPAGFKLILESGIDPDVTSDGGYTILQHLASDYCRDSDQTIRATILLDAGASLAKRDPILKSTPLGWACRWGRVDLVRLYLSRGADPIEPDSEPWATPLAWATKGGFDEIAGQLRRVSS